MATLLKVTDVNIISIDKEEDIWLIEGEAVLEDQITIGFEASFDPTYNDLEIQRMDEDLENLDENTLKEMIIEATA